MLIVLCRLCGGFTMDTQTVVMENDEATLYIPEEPYVLVVDDDQAILSVVMLLLETEGYTSLGFSDSTKVLPFLQELHATEQRLPSVMLLDLMMPVISGYEIAATIAANQWSKQITIIIMTADHRISGAHNIPGASDWLGKPFRIEVLLDKLGSYLPATCAG